MGDTLAEDLRYQCREYREAVPPAGRAFRMDTSERFAQKTLAPGAVLPSRFPKIHPP